MNFYFAPLQGLTGYIYRNAHHAYFPKGVSKYFSPFILANQSEGFKTRELNDILPENNLGINLVPQLLTNNADDFIHTAKKLKLLGYDEINLNLGCPSGTVVSKYRGSGFLAKKAELNMFLEKIFDHPAVKISVKTRIGKDRPEEIGELIEIYNKYPMEELIIHPRVQTDYYENKPDMEAFSVAVTQSRNPVCYNGDIVAPADVERFPADYPDVGTIMIGRGLLMNPGLVSEILYDIRPDKQLLRSFHDTIYESYRRTLYGEKNVLYKMKELWCYMILMFTDTPKHLKQIKKTQKLRDYEEAVALLFSESDILYGR